MEWRDQGLVLAARPHGETSIILDVLTREHGRHSGVVRGGISRKQAPFMQSGVLLDLTWRARLEEHVGSFVAEPITSFAAQALSDRLLLSGLNSVCALLRQSLPEREANQALFQDTLALLQMFDLVEVWPLAYVRWEQKVLDHLGYGLDLETCAVTGQAQDLIYISPKSGRAVSAAAGEAWKERLLPLPDVLVSSRAQDLSQILEGLTVLEYFWTHKVNTAPLPDLMHRFREVLRKLA